MYRIAKSCLGFTILLTSFCLICVGEETQVSQTQSHEPQIHTLFFSADAIRAIPKLHHLDDSDRGFNKILFKIEGFPKNKELIFEVKRTVGQSSGRYRQIFTFKIQENGTILTGDNQQLKTLVSSSKGFLPGERVTFRIHASDGSIDKEVCGIPSPIVVKDKQSNILAKIELLSLSPTVYAVDLPNMKEGEELQIKSTSLGEIITAKAKYNSKKSIHYAPAPRGNNKGGEATLEIKRKSGDYFVVKLPWGTAMNSYLNGQKNYSR